MTRSLRRRQVLAAIAGAAFSFLISFASEQSFALDGEHNLEPEACQGVFGAVYMSSEAAAALVTPPADLLPFGAAYGANLALRQCLPQILAPPPLKLEPDASSASSSDPELPDPFLDDPSCYASVAINSTRHKYQNFLGIPFAMEDWGDLGTPEVYHFNTSVDLRLLGKARADDPSTPGDESLADYWQADGRNAAGQEILKLPVGRQTLKYRADSLISGFDFAPVYIPFSLPSLSRQTVKASRSLTEAAIESASEVATDVVVTEYGEFVVGDLFFEEFRHSQLLGGPDYYNEATQDVWVYDVIPPVLTTRTDVSTLDERAQAVLSYDDALGLFYLEAIHPGGIRRNVGVDFLSGLLDYHDRCNRPVVLNHDGGGSADHWSTGERVTLRWTARDAGPRDAGGGSNSVSIVQDVEIRDSYPPILIAPPSQVVEIPQGQGQATVDLGPPRVFDLADLTPQVMHDADDDVFDLGPTEVTWQASDGVNGSQAVQLIIVKEEGTNTPPLADPQTVHVQTDEAVEIVLSGSDADFHPTIDRFDPLTFRIVERPENGFLVAPLLPYFIDDVRLEASALRFAGDLKNEDPQAYCAIDPGVRDPDDWQLGYPHRPEWMAVDDDGNTMVYDTGSVHCQVNDPEFNDRLVIFDADQNISAALEITVGGKPSDIFWDDITDYIYVARIDNNGDDFVYVYDASLTQLARYNLGTGAPLSDPWMTNPPAAVTVDSRGILYVANNSWVTAFSTDSMTPGMDPVPQDVFLGRAWEADGTVVGLGSLESLTTDSEDNLYIGFSNRIVKLSAAELGPAGFAAGELLGWLGYCSGNLTSEYACDTENQISVGYACTDALCERLDPSAPSSMSRPGQFDQAMGISIDPNDVLYVSDFGNARVQRFTPDGLFAGEAKSQGLGFGFLLGDFGQPQDIEVNSDHFYVLNRDADLLHIFETTPITPIDDSTASVLYRSAANFVGSDRFRFGVTDGLDAAEADVTVNVTRNFRPPEVPAAAQPLVVPPSFEDEPVDIVLPATDPDGAFDTLTIVIDTAPLHGEVTFSGLVATYVPDAHYVGPDAFSYRVFDGLATSDETGEVTLTIDPTEDEPTIAVEPELAVGVGFTVVHRVDAFDPDAGETLRVDVDWGDGLATSEGHFELNGQPIPVGEAVNDDGTIKDGVAATGPILGIGQSGRGVLVAEHVYTRAGTYTITSCVHDKVAIDQQTQDKLLTGASKTRCEPTLADVTLSSHLAIEVEGPEDPQAPGSDIEFSVSVHNLEFALDAASPRFPELPASGVPIVDLTVIGELASHLALLDVTSPAGACMSSGPAFECSYALIAYGEHAQITVRARLAATAPGRAGQSLGIEADWFGTRDPVVGAGHVEVAASSGPATLNGISSASGSPAGFTEITLEGTNFEEGAVVLFGGRAATRLEVIDNAMLTLLTPPQAEGTVDVTYVSPSGERSVLRGAWTYMAASSPPPPPPPPPPSPGPSPSGGGGGGATDPLALLLLAVLLTYRRGGLAPVPGRNFRTLTMLTARNSRAVV